MFLKVISRSFLLNWLNMFVSTDPTALQLQRLFLCLQDKINGEGSFVILLFQFNCIIFSPSANLQSWQPVGVLDNSNIRNYNAAPIINADYMQATTFVTNLFAYVFLANPQVYYSILLYCRKNFLDCNRAEFHSQTQTYGSHKGWIAKCSRLHIRPSCQPCSEHRNTWTPSKS